MSTIEFTDEVIGVDDKNLEQALTRVQRSSERPVAVSEVDAVDTAHRDVELADGNLIRVYAHGGVDVQLGIGEAGFRSVATTPEACAHLARAATEAAGAGPVFVDQVHATHVLDLGRRPWCTRCGNDGAVVLRAVCTEKGVWHYPRNGGPCPGCATCVSALSERATRLLQETAEDYRAIRNLCGITVEPLIGGVEAVVKERAALRFRLGVNAAPNSIYVGGGSVDRLFIAGLVDMLRVAGYEVTYDWPRAPQWDRVCSLEELKEQAGLDLDAVRRARTLWYVAPSVNKSEGSHAELGAALALGKRVVVSGDYLTLGRIFPLCAAVKFDTHTEALDYLVREMKGE